jgi:hypothetical protein
VNEDDYIAATNLAKIRAALVIVRDVLPQGHADETRRRKVMSELSDMETVYSSVIELRMRRAAP